MVVYDSSNIKGFKEYEKRLDLIKLSIGEYKDADEYDMACIFLDNMKKDYPTFAKEYGSRIRRMKRTLDLMEKDWDRIGDEEYEKTEKLYDYFVKVNSSKSLPKWAVKYSYDCIKRALKDYEGYLEGREWDKGFQPKAIKFILKHKGMPSNIQEMSEDEYWGYRVLLDKTPSALKKILSQYECQKDNSDFKPFYIASELPASEREMLIKEHSYRMIPFMNIETGKTGMNVLIKNSSKKESDYHFCLKNLYAKQLGGYFEYKVGNHRVDIVFEHKNKKLAVEIETGTNNELQIEKMVDVLDEHFDDYIIVCKREHKKKYRPYTQPKHLATMTEATKKIKEFKGK